MTITPCKELLRELCLAAGPPGAEQEVRALVRKQLSGLGDLAHDRLGSLLCEHRGTSDHPRIQIDSHMDEVGFMVQSICKEGRLGFIPLGGWWGHVLLAQRVEILTEKGRVPGVIGAKPPHFLKAEERNAVLQLESMYIDVGATDGDQVASLGVRIGDPVVPVSPFVEMAIPGAVSCKALDDRVGVGMLCEVMKALSKTEHPNTVIAVAAVQEEVGARGAKTASALAKPDLALVLEATPADDLPGFTERQAVLGKGPQIRFSDPTALANRRLVRMVEAVAREQGISIQLAVRRTGGTDAGIIHTHGIGVPTVVIGIPARSIHTHAGIMQWQDYQAGCNLVLELVRHLDARSLEELTSFE